MKGHSGTYRKGKETLTLEGGGKRVGVKGRTDVARNLRKHSTDTERHLWRYLRDRQVEGFKFRRQQTVGKYVVDFVNLEKKVIVELDGGQHALDPGDKTRDEWLRHNIRMIRITRYSATRGLGQLRSTLTQPLSPRRGSV
jgi:very-short-patch-repair endonuclease